MEPDDLVAPDGRHDVPVAEFTPRSLDRNCVAAARDEDFPSLDRVDGRSIGSRDVDAEMEALGISVSVAWVVEVATNWMLAVEGLDRPSVRGANRRAMRHGAGLREL